MRYTVVFRLRGAPAKAVAVEWTEAAEPQASGAGWEPCVRLADGSWRMASYGERDAHWRAPGPFTGIALRYRLEPAGPWSAISASRKEITLVEEVVEERPRQPVAADWSAFSVRLANGTWTGVIVTRDATLGAVDRVDWLGVDPARYADEAELEPHYEPTTPFDLEGFAIPDGERWWLFASKAAIVHERQPGTTLNQIRFRYRKAGGTLMSPVVAEKLALSEAQLVDPKQPAPLLLPPVLLAGPALVGAATIGKALKVEPGRWGGEPAPTLALQWLRDGAPIDGATGTDYVPVPEDDLCEIACRVVATNPSGTLEALAEPVVARYAAPVLKGELFDEVFDEDSGPQAVPAAEVFAGENLLFAVAGAGATIDPKTGLVTIPTDRIMSEEVVVTARNSGGVAETSFLVTVEPDAVEEVEPRQPDAADWSCFAVRLANGTWTGVVATRDEALGDVEQVDWIGVDVTKYADALALEGHYEPTRSFDLEGFAIPEGERWWLFQSKAAIVHERPSGSQLNQIRFRYRLAGGVLCSTYAADVRSLSEAQLAAPEGQPTTPPATPKGGWTVMPIRSAQEKAAGLPGGEASQHPHSVWRDMRDPNRIIWGHDMGAVWHSSTPVPFWSNSGNLGLWCYMVQSVAIHPKTGDWYAVAASAYDPGNRSLQGIYRKRASVVGTKDERWELVHQIDRIGHWRWIHETITFDSQGNVIVAVNRSQNNEIRSAPSYNGVNVSGRTVEEPGQIWRSATGNSGSWTQVGDNLLVLWGTGTKFHRITGLRAHPTNANVLYMSTWNGLWKSTNAGQAWTHLSGRNGLPTGIVRNICMNPKNGEQLYIAVSAEDLTAGVGVYYSGNGGVSWTQISTPAGAAISKIFASPVDFGTASARLYLLCRRQDLRTSGNNGGTWQTASVPGRPGSGVYTQRIIDGRNDWLGTVLPHPTIKNDAFAFANSAPHRTENAVNWVDAGFGFTGYAAAYGASFDFDYANPNNFAMGLFDVGWVETNDNGQSFRGTGPNVTDPAKNAAIHRSCYNIARLWSDNVMVSTIGTQAGGQLIIRSTNPHNPDSYVIADGNSFASHVFLRRHPGNSNVVYGQRRRSLDKGKSWQNYGGGEGFVMDMNLGNPDVVYALRGGGTSTAIGRSADRGASFQTLVSVGWSINWRDARIVTFCSDPEDTLAFWTNSSSRDLARYSPSTGWKTDFRIREMVNGLVPGGLPNNSGGVGHIAVDRQDRNRVFAVWHYPGASKVLMSLNAWAGNPTWTDVTEDLPVTPGSQAIIHPVTREVFYATNGNGNYRRPFAK